MSPFQKMPAPPDTDEPPGPDAALVSFGVWRSSQWSYDEKAGTALKLIQWEHQGLVSTTTGESIAVRYTERISMGGEGALNQDARMQAERQAWRQLNEKVRRTAKGSALIMQVHAINVAYELLTHEIRERWRTGVPAGWESRIPELFREAVAQEASARDRLEQLGGGLDNPSNTTIEWAVPVLPYRPEEAEHGEPDAQGTGR